MQETLSSIWRPVKGVFMEETSFPNLFMFKFFHELDIKRVLDDGPWTFNQQVLLFKRMDVNEQLKDIRLTDVYLWVQIYDLPIGFNSECVLRSIGDYLGKFLEVDPKNFQGLWRNYLRVKVAIDVQFPLKSRMKIKKAGGEWLWINFKYERLPSFCFYCGLIGHSDKFCEALFDNPQAGDERKYDSSLRAPLKRQNTSKGNQWLRDANGSSVILSNSGGYGDIPVEDGGQDGKSTNSRDLRNTQREKSNQISLRDNIALNQEVTDIDDLNEEDYGPNNEGIVVSKQKRARKDMVDTINSGLNIYGLQDKHNEMDTDISYTQNKEDTISKNLQMVGATAQALQSSRLL
ncbi:hypothetical protein POM88_004096 [Heracleum sosnowskyi]|uniref:CCHC-type domain-containing protein n=1 Tax=Heracleum sosnowskyi TaxID=360622 RepID=A0AAD8NDQ0_9APIA|nr:hypothetical protein POM88_004096 [Heracleum sosnowskyi]